MTRRFRDYQYECNVELPLLGVDFLVAIVNRRNRFTGNYKYFVAGSLALDRFGQYVWMVKKKEKSVAIRFSWDDRWKVLPKPGVHYKENPDILY